tara:strand:- start:38578 stop:38883 length:306 start_codon:yes stop_codon:yes gene_type:complete
VLLLIDSELTEPPSSVTLFRDITLYAATFKKMDIILEAKPVMQDYYYKWLKERGAFDFIKDILDYEKEYGKTIRYRFGRHAGNVSVRSIGYHNFQRIIGSI